MAQHWNAVVDLIHTGPWWKNRSMVHLNFVLLLPLLTSAINGFDSSVLNGLQIVPDFTTYFKIDQSQPEVLGTALVLFWEAIELIGAGLLNAAQNIGALLALPIAPYLSDGLGRRITLCIGSVIMLGGVALQCTATGVTQLILARGTIGVGLNISLNAAPLLITELAYPTQRAQITAMYNSNWYLGAVVAAWACYGAYVQEQGSFWAWRIPSLVQAVPSVIQVILVWFIPESPRWLIAKGRIGEARKVLAKYHAHNDDIRDPLVAFEVTQIQHALRMEHEISKTTSYLTLFSTPGNRRRMRIIIALALFSQWSGNGLISYYISIVLSKIGITFATVKGQINGSLQAFNFVVAVAASLLVERLGRRTLFLTSNAGMLIVFGLWTAMSALFEEKEDSKASIVFIVLIFFFYMFYDLTYTPLLVSYSLEILPYNIRARGFALMNTIVCLSLAFNQFVNPIALNALGWKYYLVYNCWLAFELVFVMRYVIETRGRTLEETAALFDGEQPALELQQLGHEAATLTLNEMQANTLRARLDARLQEDNTDNISTNTTEKLPVDTSEAELASGRESQQIQRERHPSIVSIHLP